MIEMPPLQFAQVNGIRMGYYEAGPKSDKPPLILCHGWPEIAFSWRHQIKALSEAGIRVDRAGSARLWRDRPARAGRGLRHGASDRRSRRTARPSQDRQGDFRRPRLGRFHRLADAAAPHRSGRRRDRRQHAALRTAPRPIRSSCCVSASASRCISCSSRIPAASLTGFSQAASSRPLMPSCASRWPRRRRRTGGAADCRRRRVAAAQSGVSADDRELRRQTRSAHADPVAGGEEGVRRYFHQDRLHRRHQLVPQLFAQLAALGRSRPYGARAVADDHGRERRSAAAVGRRRHGEDSFPIWKNISCAAAAIWTQQEKPDEVSAKLIEWRKKAISVEERAASSLRAKRSNPWRGKTRMDCFVARSLRKRFAFVAGNDGVGVSARQEILRQWRPATN